MAFNSLDLTILIGFYLLVLALSLWKSRAERNSADYFLAGRALPWWLIGISIVAANLSTEQFVGMAGQAAGSVGLAVSGWQLTSSAAIVVIALVFVPRFLRAGIYTMPEYLEYRYSSGARIVMSVLTIVIYTGVTMAAVLYSGGTVLEAIFGLKLANSVPLVAVAAAALVLWGGLPAAIWADLLLGPALLLGGLLTAYLAIKACGGTAAFLRANADKLHMVLPRGHPELPWTVLVGGIWIPVFYYCGLNQFIMQRALAARSLKHAQYGVLFAGALWLLVPFAIVMPGIAAHQLFGPRLERADQAYPTLIREVIPAGARGFIFAALSGAVISCLAAILNSTSTLFTIDIYKRYLRRDASERSLVLIGRVSSLVFLAIACAVSLSDRLKGGVFSYIQEFQGYISPGILAAFAFGFVVKKAPPSSGMAALALSAPIYGLLQWRWGEVAYLNRMVVTFGALLVIMAAITSVAPLRIAKVLPEGRSLDLDRSPAVAAWGAVLLLGVAGFFLAFW